MQDEIITQSTPTLETLWADARAGRIAWAAVQEYQAGMVPRCKRHPDRPMATYEAGAALCADCYVALVKARREEATDAVA